MDKIIFTNSDFDAVHEENSGAMKKIMQSEQVSKLLSSSADRQKFYDALKKHRGERHGEDTIKKALGELKSIGRISESQAERIGSNFISSGPKFILPGKEEEKPEIKKSESSRPIFVPFVGKVGGSSRPPSNPSPSHRLESIE